MSPKQVLLMPLVLCCAAATAPALAATSASSASFEGSSASVGSLSTSIGTSSNSSTKTDKVAEGDYRIIETAATDKQPGALRLTLQALNAADGEFYLYLPQAAVQQARLATGGVVSARHHAYGVEFAAGSPRAAFFLVLHDAWYQELQNKVVKL